MHTAFRIASAAVLCGLTTWSAATTTTYTSSSAFMAQLSPTYYTETFDSLSNLPPGPANFVNGSFAYNISAPSDLDAYAGYLSSSQIDEALTITFTSGNVYSVGGNFFSSNISSQLQATNVTLTLGDGTVVSFTPSTMDESFRGFVSDQSITSLTLSAPGQSLYASVDNLTVGTVSAVPEPSSWALMGLGIAGLLLARRRAV